MVAHNERSVNGKRRERQARRQRCAPKQAQQARQARQAKQDQYRAALIRRVIIHDAPLSAAEVERLGRLTVRYPLAHHDHPLVYDRFSGIEQYWTLELLDRDSWQRLLQAGLRGEEAVRFAAIGRSRYLDDRTSRPVRFHCLGCAGEYLRHHHPHYARDRLPYATVIEREGQVEDGEDGHSVEQDTRDLAEPGTPAWFGQLAAINPKQAAISAEAFAGLVYPFLHQPTTHACCICGDMEHVSDYEVLTPGAERAIARLCADCHGIQQRMGSRFGPPRPLPPESPGGHAGVRKGA